MLRYTVLGARERGTPDAYTREWRTPLTPTSAWHGWVAAHDGDYSDAVVKGFGVTLMATETSGAVSATLDAMLRRYDRISREPGTADYTTYGASRTSPGTFYRHHLAAHAAAVVFTDAATLVDDATTKSFWLARGMPELAWSAATACDAAPDPEGA